MTIMNVDLVYVCFCECVCLCVCVEILSKI